MQSFMSYVKNRDYNLAESFSAMMPTSTSNSNVPNAEKESFPAPDPKAMRKFAYVVDALQEIAIHLGKNLQHYTAQFPREIIPWPITKGRNDFNAFVDFLGSYLRHWKTGYGDGDQSRVEFFHNANKMGNNIDENKVDEAKKKLIKRIEEHPEEFKNGVTGLEMREMLKWLEKDLHKYM